MSITTALLMVPVALVALPAATLLLEVVAAIVGPRPIRTREEHVTLRGRVAVLVPAHDEGRGLIPTLSDLKGQLRSGDRLVVVADNCSDDTASVAVSMGAEVTVRLDRQRVGKGFALDWGLNYLALDPPDIVIISDADCRIGEGAIDRLADHCCATQRPIQALYLMTAPAESTVNYQVAEFAWRLKNWIRPLGLATLGLPCQLMGSGMAFPWKTIRSAELSSGFIVEDLKLGLDLAIVGSAPLFLPSAKITSTFPTTARGAEVQRHRWEQGHVSLIFGRAPRLLFQAARNRNIEQLALVLDLVVPPLSLLGAALLLITTGTALSMFFGGPSLPLVASLFCILLVVASIFLAWTRFGRDILPIGSLSLVARYAFAKMKLYQAVMLGRRISHWVRADRG